MRWVRRIPSKSEDLQKGFVIIVMLLVVLIPLGKAVSWEIWDWPSFPKHRDLDPKKYAERISLLKYMISLGFSIIGATWLFAHGTIGGSSINPKNRLLLNWAWAFLGIAVLSGFLEIYLTYKDFHYWPLIAAEGGGSSFRIFLHCFSIHILHLSYYVTDLFFFAGAVILILSLLGSFDISKNDKV